MTTFSELGLNQKILKAIEELGFEKPTPVQSEVIPAFLAEQRDIIALAQTGTGKTAAFGLPILHLLDPSNKKTQALVLSPTRELCVQIYNDLLSFSKFMDKISVVAVYGGASIINQIKQLERGAQIIVATPGRLIDLLERKKINLANLKYLILDEADEMLNMGFKEDIDLILQTAPYERTTLLFSATMPPEIAKIAKLYMKNPDEITIGRKNSGAENISHVYYTAKPKDKYLVLKRIVDYNPDIYGLVFCRTKAETQEIADLLIRDGYSADALHGDLGQAQRDTVMKKFRSKMIQILVATDVAARGIDVDNLSHVINYHLPDETEQYTHRSGRTGRAGKTGVAVSIVCPGELHKIKGIEKQISKKLVLEEVPNGLEVCEKQLIHQIDTIKNIEVNEKGIDKYLPKIMEEFKDLSKEELITKIVSAEFNRFLDYYKNAADLNIKTRSVDSIGDLERIFLNLGKLDGFDREKLRKFLAQKANLSSSVIREIDINHAFTFFTIEQEHTEQLFKAFKKVKFNNRNIRLDRAENNSKFGGSSRTDGRKSRNRGGKKKGSQAA